MFLASILYLFFIIEARFLQQNHANLQSTPAIKKLLKIGELAKETGETLHTIRHWIEKGLLEVAEHTEAGYQLFDRLMIERVKEIRKLQKVERLSIDEIRKKLESS